MFNGWVTRKPHTVIAICLLLTATRYSHGQGMKDYGNRLEGTNVHPNALEDFTLLAVHKTFAAFPRSTNLNVRFFLPKLDNNSLKSVFLEAVELQDSFHYFMKAKNPSWKDGTWNVFQQWPTKDVIDALGIQADNLGVLAGYRLGDSRTVYLPVDVYPSGLQLPVRAYTFYFITGQDLQSLDISVTNAAGQEVGLHKPPLRCNKTLNPACRLFSGGSTHAFDLDMSSLPQGEYHLKLLGHVPGTSTPTSLDIAVYHHP
jgi:hypothetical protein